MIVRESFAMNIIYRILEVLLIILLLGVIGAVILYFYPGIFAKTPISGGTPQNRAHFYQNSAISISNVLVKTVYVVPKNREPYSGWHDIFTKALDKVQRFHNSQFRGASTMNYEIFGEPIILLENNLKYDSGETTSSSPYVLLNLSGELNHRLFEKDGDLYNQAFAKKNGNEYAVLGVFYEGIGALGSPIHSRDQESIKKIAEQLGLTESVAGSIYIGPMDGFFILSREYLTNPILKSYGPTVLYHEFAHAIGFKDQYDRISGRSFSDDIMGGGRENPIEAAYLGKPLLQESGVVEKK